MKPIRFQGAWPALPIEQYQRIDDGPWGYLEIYADGDFCFDGSRTPTLAEIVIQWPQFEGCICLSASTGKPLPECA